MRLRTKIPALLVPLVVAPLLLLGMLAYFQLRATTIDHVYGGTRAALAHVSALMRAEADTASGNLQLFTTNGLVDQYALADEVAARDTLRTPLLQLFADYQSAFPDYFEIRFLQPDGHEDARQTRPYIENVSNQEGDSALFKTLAAAGDAPYSTVFIHPDTGRPALFVGAALYRRDTAREAITVPAELRGYLGISMRMSALERAIEEARIGESGFLFATDAAGQVLMAGAPVELPADFARRMTDIVGARNPVELAIAGTRTMLLGTRLHDNLVLFSALPQLELRALVYQTAIAVIAIVLLAIAITGGGLVSALELLVVRPVSRLRAVAAEIGRGNWNITSGIRSADEIGDLAHAFEDMARNLKDADDRVRYLAYHDNLTGLPNRVMFRDYLTRALSQADRARRKLSILFLDIDGFKRVNDTLGHQAGDQLLKEVARRLSARMREEDMLVHGPECDAQEGLLARLGGDEFIVLLAAIQDLHGPGTVARRFIETLGEVISLNGQECYIGASIGIAIYPDDGADAGELIKNADIAMYHAKSVGKNAYQYFQESMNATALERAALESRLRKAIADNHFSLHYQPQIDPVTREIVGLEALMRWTDPDTGSVSPSAFIPLAEETGLILTLGEWAIDEACRQARAWDARGLRSIPISVNVSGVQFERQDVAQVMQDALHRHRLGAHRLEVEITESAIMRHPERAVEALRRLKAAGVGVALDDFGTGYSSLGYLRRFPIDTLKIDRSFIVEIADNQEDAEIVAAIVAMAHTLGLRVVVEGVETADQLEVVIDKHCDIVQGYVFCRPLSAPDIAEMLSEAQLRIA